MRPKVAVYVVSRNGGGTDGGWVGANALGRLFGHLDLLLPIPLSRDNERPWGVSFGFNGSYDDRGEWYFDEKPEYEMVGFFGSNGTCSGSSAPGSGTERTGSFGMGLDGYLMRSLALWESEGRGRLESTQGKAGGIRSSICRLLVCPEQALSMIAMADEIEKNPGKFYIVGRNCSVSGARILEAGGLETNMYPVTTPDNVFNTIFRTFPVHSMFCGPGYTVYDHAGARIEWEDRLTPGNIDDWAALTPNPHDYDPTAEGHNPFYPNGY